MAHIVIAAPVRPSANSGNDVTANRWSALLKQSGHHVVVIDAESVRDASDHLRRADLLLALHARRSAPVVAWWAEHRVSRPMVVGLAGTDLYRDMPDDGTTMASVAAADALVVLQHAAIERLRAFDPAWGQKAHTIHQSVAGPLPQRAPAANEFRVVVLAHLRAVKDPLLAANAMRLLPADSTAVVHHAGRAHDAHWTDAATTEATENPRYVWHGELAATEALDLLSTAAVLACTSVSEGGANVVSEAIALGVPVIGTRIDGNTGILGADHPGLFSIGDAHALAAVVRELETDPAALAAVTERSRLLQPITNPATERALLTALVDSLL